MSNEEVLAQIARLESELLRIQSELLELRARVVNPAGPPRTGPQRRTRAFTPLDGPASEGKVSVVERRDHHDYREAVTQQLPAQRAESEARLARSQAEISDEAAPTTKSDRRVPINRSTGLTDFPPAEASEPPATHPSAGRRPALTDPGAGRYEYYDESGARSQRRR